MTRRHLLVLAILILTAALLAGCANKAAAPAQAGTAQGNTRLSPEAQQRMMQAGQTQQRAGRIRGQLMHRSQGQPQ